MEREDLYIGKCCEALDLLGKIAGKITPLKFIDGGLEGGDLEVEINRLTFLAVKLRQILKYAEGG